MGWGQGSWAQAPAGPRVQGGRTKMFDRGRKEQMSQQMVLSWECGGRKVSLLRVQKGYSGPLRAWHFHCCGLGLNSGWGTEILQAVWHDKNCSGKGFQMRE